MDDLISREWVKKRMTFEPDYEVVLMAQKVDAEPVRHGKWVHGIILNHEWRKCSECLVSQEIFGCFTYFPNCGARMDGGAET